MADLAPALLFLPPFTWIASMRFGDFISRLRREANWRDEASARAEGARCFRNNLVLTVYETELQNRACQEGFEEEARKPKPKTRKRKR